MVVPAVGHVESFLERRVNQRTMGPQLVIALIAGVAFSTDMLAVYATLGEAQRIYGGLVLVLMLLYAVIPILLWATATAAVYIAASLVKARVELNLIWRMLGWGMIPLIGVGFSLGASRYSILTSRQPCEPLVCDVSTYVDITTQAEDVLAYSGSALGEPLMQVAIGVSVLLFLVMTYLWIVISYQATTLTRTGAAIVGGIPGLTLTAVFAFLIL